MSTMPAPGHGREVSLCDYQHHMSRRTLLGAGGGSLMMSAIAQRLVRADRSEEHTSELQSQD